MMMADVSVHTGAQRPCMVLTVHGAVLMLFCFFISFTYKHTSCCRLLTAISS
jgi:hypothetical protein